MPKLYRGRRVSLPIRARMANIGVEYPPEGSGWTVPTEVDPRLDPLLHIKRNTPPRVATFISTGTADQVLEDSQRLHSRLEASGVPNQLDVLPGGGHAFQGLLFKPSVREVWQRCEAFLCANGLSFECRAAPPVGSAAAIERMPLSPLPGLEALNQVIRTHS
jgi:acetyl esterase/lipase